MENQATIDGVTLLDLTNITDTGVLGAALKRVLRKSNDNNTIDLEEINNFIRDKVLDEKGELVIVKND